MNTPTLYETYRAWQEVSTQQFLGYLYASDLIALMKKKNSAIASTVKFDPIMQEVLLHEVEFLPMMRIYKNIYKGDSYYSKLVNRSWEDLLPITNADGEFVDGGFKCNPKDGFRYRLKELNLFDFDAIPPDAEWYWLAEGSSFQPLPAFSNKLFQKIRLEYELPYVAQFPITDINDPMLKILRTKWVCNSNGYLQLYDNHTCC